MAGIILAVPLHCAVPSPCTWVAAEEQAHFCLSTETDTPSLSGGYKGVRACPGRAAVRTCALNAPTRGVLIGPFHAAPGAWTSISLEPTSGSRTAPWLLAEGDCVVDFQGAGVHADGVPIGYPPLHVHHLHVERGSTTHFFETHGDYDRSPNATGIGEYGTALPAGFCMRVGKRPIYLIEAVLNDVRYTAPGLAMSTDSSHLHAPHNRSHSSMVLEWYLRVLFTIAPSEAVSAIGVARTVQPACKLILFHPITTYALDDSLQRYDAGTTPRVLFWSYRMRRGGRLLLPVWLHSHRARDGGVVLIAGHHTIASLTNGTFTAAHTIDALRDLVVARAGNRVVCRPDPSVPSVVHLSEAADGSLGGQYDRPGALICSSHEWRAGDRLTVFAFSEPRWAIHNVHFPQHTMIFAFFASPTGGSTLAGAGAESCAESDVEQMAPPWYGSYEIGVSHSYLHPRFTAAGTSTSETESLFAQQSGSCASVLHEDAPGGWWMPDDVDGVLEAEAQLVVELREAYLQEEAEEEVASTVQLPRGGSARPRAAHTCAAFSRHLPRLGFNGLLRAMRHVGQKARPVYVGGPSHLLGAFAASRADGPQAMRAAIQLAACEGAPTAGYQPLHGLVWHSIFAWHARDPIAATHPHHVWALAMKICCPITRPVHAATTHCVHGVGHAALMLAAAGRGGGWNEGTCSPPARHSLAISPAVLGLASAICDAAPNPLFRTACGLGMYMDSVDAASNSRSTEGATAMSTAAAASAAAASSAAGAWHARCGSALLVGSCFSRLVFANSAELEAVRKSAWQCQVGAPSPLSVRGCIFGAAVAIGILTGPDEGAMVEWCAASGSSGSLGGELGSERQRQWRSCMGGFGLSFLLRPPTQLSAQTSTEERSLERRATSSEEAALRQHAGRFCLAFEVQGGSAAGRDAALGDVCNQLIAVALAGGSTQASSGWPRAADVWLWEGNSTRWSGGLADAFP